MSVPMLGLGPSTFQLLEDVPDDSSFILKLDAGRLQLLPLDEKIGYQYYDSAQDAVIAVGGSLQPFLDARFPRSPDGWVPSPLDGLNSKITVLPIPRQLHLADLNTSECEVMSPDIRPYHSGVIYAAAICFGQFLVSTPHRNKILRFLKRKSSAVIGQPIIVGLDLTISTTWIFSQDCIAYDLPSDSSLPFSRSPLGFRMFGSICYFRATLHGRLLQSNVSFPARQRGVHEIRGDICEDTIFRQDGVPLGNAQFLVVGEAPVSLLDTCTGGVVGLLPSKSGSDLIWNNMAALKADSIPQACICVVLQAYLTVRRHGYITFGEQPPNDVHLLPCLPVGENFPWCLFLDRVTFVYHDIPDVVESIQRKVLLDFGCYLTYLPEENIVSLHEKLHTPLYGSNGPSLTSSSGQFVHCTVTIPESIHLHFVQQNQEYVMKVPGHLFKISKRVNYTGTQDFQPSSFQSLAGGIGRYDEQLRDACVIGAHILKSVKMYYAMSREGKALFGWNSEPIH